MQSSKPLTQYCGQPRRVPAKVVLLMLDTLTVTWLMIVTGAKYELDKSASCGRATTTEGRSVVCNS